jgi:SAM-dependent methyltransferase
MSTDTVVRALERTHFRERVAMLRRRTLTPYEPWPDAPGEAAGSDPLWSLLYLGKPDPLLPEPRLLAALAERGLASTDGQPGMWEATAFGGIVAVRDRLAPPGRRDVYIGEDSLRFAETILAARPQGTALDVGCGSGISSCALARTCEHVLAIDIVAPCLAATRLSADLNGLGARITTSRQALARISVAEPVTCLAGNLPGVPVPPGVAYPPEGDGGPDGLRMMRSMLERAPELLDRRSGMLLMRFQSLGNASGPLLLKDIQRFAEQTSFDVDVVADGKLPAMVRSALTVHHATRASGQASSENVLAAADQHADELSLPLYFSCSLVGRSGGSGVVSYSDLSGPALWDAELRLAGRPADPAALAPLEDLYRCRSHDLPDGFWELGSSSAVAAPLSRLAAIQDRLIRPATVRQLAEDVFPDYFDRDPLRARSLYVTTEVMAGCLHDGGVLAVARPAGSRIPLGASRELS